VSEVDRLSNSGLYPALPIADKQRDKNPSPGKPPPAREGKPPEPTAVEEPRPPKSIIDEYA
jgi:hypothetical protein